MNGGRYLLTRLELAALRFTYIRPRRSARPSHASVNATLITMKPLALMAVRAPNQTRPAETESPARMTNVSMTCLALYLASGDVTSHSACRVVFESE